MLLITIHFYCSAINRCFDVMKLNWLLSIVFCALYIGVQSQSAQSVQKKSISKEVKNDWHNLDFESDKIYGTEANRVYAELIGDKKAKKKIVVAVIDSGVDIEHEDLRANIWTNADEIPDNGKDDDKNGYVDDVHGWNFLVDDEGNDLHHDNLEATRVLRTNKAVEAETMSKPSWLTDEMVSNSREIYNDNVAEFESMKQLGDFYVVLDSILTAQTGDSNYTFEEAVELEHSEDPMKSINRVLRAFKLGGVTKADLKDMYETGSKFENYYLNYDYAPRTELTASDKFYGNNHYEGPEADHGTHVSGLIASDRMNKIGSRGIASPVAEIMVIRAVPDGDERDVDVANAIRYAADNGASIINMSFGKGVSPQKDLVHDAIDYAAKKNVLVVHAAGNDSEDNDVVANFPNPYTSPELKSPTYMTIGASSISKKKDLVASFSNYGNLEVDLFAPGHNVYSTLPNNEYKLLSGTSMAAPVASGVAALVWAYHPELTAAQLKDVLMKSVTALPKKKVKLPGSKDKIRFGELSQSGGVVNAYQAFLLADKMSN
jgi:subtilisin family serine protease